jgi:hypothetical protein
MYRRPATLTRQIQRSRQAMAWRPAGLALALLACLIVAGCARRDGSADDNRSGGFYGGVSGGMTRP